MSSLKWDIRTRKKIRKSISISTTEGRLVRIQIIVVKDAVIVQIGIEVIAGTLVKKGVIVGMILVTVTTKVNKNGEMTRITN